MQGQVTISVDLMFTLVEHLSQGHIYTLMGTKHEHELSDDFKPEKWEPYTLEYAEACLRIRRRVLHEMDAGLNAGASGFPLLNPRAFPSAE